MPHTACDDVDHKKRSAVQEETDSSVGAVRSAEGDPNKSAATPKHEEPASNKSGASDKTAFGGVAKGPSLYDILLAGTHDSAAYDARPELLSRTAPAAMHASAVRALTSRVQCEFALTQSLSVGEQLDAGARFLDLRVSKRAGTPQSVDEFWTIHGMVLCVPLSDVVAQINAFNGARRGARDAPVVLAVRAYALSPREHAALGAYLVRQLDGEVFVGDAATLGATPVKRLPACVLAGVPPSRLGAQWGADVWTNTYCARTKIAFLDSALDSAKVKRARDCARLLVLGWTVTPNVVDVALRFVSWGVLRRTVMEEAVDMNCLFPKFAASRANALRDKVNVVFFDCFTEKEAQLLRSVAQGRDKLSAPG